MFRQKNPSSLGTPAVTMTQNSTNQTRRPTVLYQGRSRIYRATIYLDYVVTRIEIVNSVPNTFGT
jgi:hypothetical protein